jgi:hypothetical protein
MRGERPDDGGERNGSARISQVTAVLCLAVLTLGAIPGVLDRLVPRPRRVAAAGRFDVDQRGAGVAASTVVVDLWFPATLRELANGICSTTDPVSSETLARELQRPERESSWYALRYRMVQRDGGVTHITLIRNLSEVARAPGDAPELPAVLARIQGARPIASGWELGRARLHEIPAELANRDPAEVFPLLDRPMARHQGAGGEVGR